jgi:hypothetical protein
LNIGTLVNGETLALTGSGSVASKDAGTGKTVTLGTLALGNGTGLASNYTFTGGTQTADITQAILTGTVAAPDKIYDGNTAADFTVSAFTGLVGTETVVVSGVATFNSKDVADANLVTVGGITLIDGANGGLASNYSFSNSATATAHITARELTVAGQTAVDKVYDGTTTATLIGGSLIGVVAGETVTLNQAGTFASAAAGSGIAVTAADSLGGTAAANYTLAQPTGLAASITALPVENPPPMNSPVDVTAVDAYRGAIAYVSSNVPAAPARTSSVSAPASTPASAPVSVSSPGAVVSYDLAGLNLTIIAPDTSLPTTAPLQDTEDKK